MSLTRHLSMPVNDPVATPFGRSDGLAPAGCNRSQDIETRKTTRRRSAAINRHPVFRW